MSLQSALQHLAMSAGGIFSSRLLTTSPTGQLDGIDKIVVTSSGLVIAGAILVVFLSNRVKLREN